MIGRRIRVEVRKVGVVDVTEGVLDVLWYWKPRCVTRSVSGLTRLDIRWSWLLLQVLQMSSIQKTINVEVWLRAHRVIDLAAMVELQR